MQVQVSCPNCNAEIRSEDININKLVAKCHQCHTLFGYETMLQQVNRERASVVMPVGIIASSMLSALHLEITWRKTSMLGFFVFFALFWNGLLIPFIAVALAQGEWIIILFISLHLLVGLGLLYYTIALFFNKTYITVSRQNIRIEHKPIPVPFYADRQVTTKQVQQLYLDKYVDSRTNGRPNFAYEVRALLNNKKRVSLVKGLKQYEQARYIEQEVERFLNIKDYPVEGEWME